MFYKVKRSQESQCWRDKRSGQTCYMYSMIPQEPCVTQKDGGERIGTYKVLIKYIVLLVLLHVCSEGDSGLNERRVWQVELIWNHEF